jgi:type II secretory pathway predicted ATPase ExeA
MYKRFYGLRENPFNVNPDPRYLYKTQSTEEALACLTYGIQSRKGFILLTGEVGTGKTTLLNQLLDWLHQERVATAFIFNSRLSVNQLFDYMMADFGLAGESRLKSQFLMRLNQWLLDRYRAGENTVLIIDEAQNLSPQVLEEIRLLTNLETASEKLLQIVLAGQPELERKLSQPQLRQLRQRITLRAKTRALTVDEIRGYIHERLRIAGAGEEVIFSEEAIERIHFYSRGIPRVVNLLCEHALISGFVDQQRPIAAGIVEEVAREFELHEIEPTAPPQTEEIPPVDGENQQTVETLWRTLVQVVDRLRQLEAIPNPVTEGNHEPHPRSIEKSATGEGLAPRGRTPAA